MLLKFQLLPRRTKTLVALGCFAVVAAAIFIIQLLRDVSLTDSALSIVPVLAALIALSSLLATSYASWSNWTRQRRLDTVTAWNTWSDSTRDARFRTTQALGMQSIPKDVGQALANDSPIEWEGRNLNEKDVRRAIVNDLVVILNGLERLSCGVRLGVYDLEMLRMLGGTIILREYQRGSSYITGRREAHNAERQQLTAFRELELVAQDLESANLGDQKSRVDKKRLDLLNRQ